MNPEVYLVLFADKYLHAAWYMYASLDVLVYLLLQAHVFHSAQPLGCCHPWLIDSVAYYLIDLYLQLLLLVFVV